MGLDSGSLMLHFCRNGDYLPGGTELLILERGEGPYVFDTSGRRYIDGLSSLFCCQLGYSYGSEFGAVAGAQLDRLAFNTNWATAHPPALELAERLVERSPPATAKPSSPAVARSRSRRPGRSSASTTSPTASRAGSKRSPATSPTTGSPSAPSP